MSYSVADVPSTSPRTVTAVLFDKTGTLTEGRHAVTGVSGGRLSADEASRLAGGVEADSEHPVARAIVAAAKSRGDVAVASEFKAITGRGVEASIDQKRYAVGGPVMVPAWHASVPRRRSHRSRRP